MSHMPVEADAAGNGPQTAAKFKIQNRLQPLRKYSYEELPMKRITLTMLFALLWCASMVAQSYSFKTVVYRDPNVSFTQLLGINNNGIIAGYHNFQQNQGFTLVLPNAFTTENFPNSMMTQVVGINNTGTTDGFYVDNSGLTHGFFRTSNGQFTTVDYPRPEIATSFNQLLSQNDYYEAAGYYSNSINNTTPDIPYVYDEIGGVFHVITIPGAVGGAQATGINNSGTVCGFWIDANNVNHGYLLNRGIFMTLDVPGSTFTQALGLNNNGQVVGSFIDAGGQTHGFVYYIGTARFVTVNEPNGVGTTIVNGINDAGTLVGFYGTAPINTGFVATPTTDATVRDSVRPESVSPVAVRVDAPETDSVNVPPSNSPVAIHDVEQLDNGSTLPSAISPVSVIRSVRPVAVGGTVPPVDSPVAVR
jgi:probable HAF family extracellular repeat protein